MDDPKSEKVALFRYGLIATLVLETLSRGELMRRARELAALEYDIPASARTRISVATLLKWARGYRKGGLDALSPKRRHDRGQSRVISPQLGELIERLKRENPHRTGTTLLRELALSADSTTAPLSAATLYRFLKEHGLTQKQLLAPPAHKKFEAEFANQIWQSDMMFGPYVPRPDGGKQQAMLYALLDDASRLIPHLFFFRLDRVVRRDSTFLLQKRFYEAPPHLAGQKVEVRFDPLDASQPDVFFGGVFQGAARLADPVANGLWTSAKSEPAPASQSTGINYVELLYQKREDGDV